MKTAEELSYRAAPPTETSPQMRKRVRFGLVVLLCFAALMTGIGLRVYSSFDTSYRDGYNYASRFVGGGAQFQGCHRDVMIYDAHEPNDDYSQWTAGCRAEAMNPDTTSTPGNNGALGRKPRLIY